MNKQPISINIFVIYDKEAEEILVAFEKEKDAQNYKKSYQYPKFIEIERICLIK